jgi:hypothetical protein
MSKWTDIRDTVVEALQVDAVGKNLKDNFITWLTQEGIVLLEAAADRIIEECKTDAPNETGWCKIRDAFVVPAALNIGIYILKVVLEKAAAEV